ncbi:hypothetical protein BDAP_002522 [Binucleata daphniae]
MIKAFLSYNQNTKETLFKPFVPILNTVQQNIIQNFTSFLQKNIENDYFQTEMYTFSFITLKNTLFSLISEDENDKIEMYYILNHIKPLLSDDFYNVNYVISEVFPYTNTNIFTYNLLNLDNLKNILVAESNDERIYENMMKSKELENYQKLKDMKRTKSDNIDKQLEKVRNIELEMRKEQIKQLEALKITSEPEKMVKNKRKINKMEGDFVVTIKEKLNVIVDKEMNIKECSINGDLSVIVRKEELRKEKIKIKSEIGDMKDVKFSPNIDKEKAKKNVLYSEKGYPLNKNVALMKWKRKTEIPLDFSFWVSETNDDNKCSVQFEYETKEKVKDLTFYINKRNVQIENCKTVDGKYEWKGENGVEVICDNYEDMFPIYVDFWSDECKFMVDVEDEKIKVQRIFEVDKFEIRY